MSNTKLIYTLYQIGAIQFGDFKLKSGQTSSIYLNLRKIISYPDLLRLVAEAIWEKVSDRHFNLICGVPYTALPIATCLSLTHSIPMIMRRKEKKDYGTKQMIEGVFQPGERCLIVEDVITTGSSIIETANELEAAGLQIQDVVALVDREQGGKNNLNTKYKVFTVLSLTDIFNTLLSSKQINSSERYIIENLLLARSA